MKPLEVYFDKNSLLLEVLRKPIIYLLLNLLMVLNYFTGRFIAFTSLLMNCILGGLLFCSLFGMKLHAQEIENREIEFARGNNSQTIEAKIVGEKIIDYLLNVKKGQYLNISMATDNRANYFNIMEPNEGNRAIFNGSIGENMFEGIAEASGDYTIRVYLMRSAARRLERANFRLELVVSEEVNLDALVDNTEYNATGILPCKMDKEKAGFNNCDFGIKRENYGTGILTIRKPDGRSRSIFFEDGKAIGYDKSEADIGELDSSKSGDLYLIQIGEEQYQIPEAVIFGG
ncbi:hypothetical protein [Eudoraea chungangensis]|uniref:hypothetical protein n=1 Tax=Eudoraea chungangensis TaxID=1481905 RepID=UPI0023EB72A7|nr:hypothetical protein [Eudoraea chungangensis]